MSWITSSTNDEEAYTLTAALVAVRSYPGEEFEVQQLVANWLEQHGLTPEFQDTQNKRPNVLARIENGTGPTLLLNCLLYTSRCV